MGEFSGARNREGTDGTGDPGRIGEILAVGSRPAGSSQVQLADAPPPGEPTLRWRSRARSIEEIEQELARIWAEPNLTVMVEGEPGRRIAARTSVMNLVVVARHSEVGEHCAAIISRLAGRHPSRTMILSSADPDGPSWLDAQIQAHCVLPNAEAAETCAELIYLTAGGESGRHLQAIVAPLLIHDLPVLVWWPGELPVASKATDDVFAIADRLIVDGSTWSGDGLERLPRLARLLERGRVSVTDLALLRQSRWREAIASTFDDPDLTPYLRSLRRISVTYGTHDETGAPGSTNLVKPVYHVAWLASRLKLSVVKSLHPAEGRSSTAKARPRAGGNTPPMARGLAATLSTGKGEVAVVVRPVLSPMPAGTTLRVELLCERRGSELRVDVTAEKETVNVRAWQDGVAILERGFLAPRRTEVDLLAETIEATDRDTVSIGAIRAAAALATATTPGGLAPGEPIRSSAAGLA
ncbi:MAG TPA: glucose-6-phosphate dehydrogenase assembly protein OpcA [Candidatus Limnocylindrales bacterium]